MTRKLVISSFLLFLYVALHAAEKSTFNAVSIQPTPAFLRLDNGREARMARLLFNGGKFTGKATVDIRFNGLTSQQTLDAKDGIDAFELILPGEDISRNTQLYVTFNASGMQYSASAIIQPTRRWTVYLLPHSHVDVGYTHRQDYVSKLHTENIDYALDVIDKTRNNPEGERFVWNVEVMWVVDEYLRKADKPQAERFWRAVKEGYIDLGSCFVNECTSNISTQGLIVSFQYAAQQAKEHGVTINCMYQGDIPGATWGISAISSFAEQRYFLLGINAEARLGFMRKYLEDEPFYWVAPNGKDKILFYLSQPYTLGFWSKGIFLRSRKSRDDWHVPYYTGDPYKYFCDPLLFPWIDEVAARNQPYDMLPITWSLNDNAPIDPELPDAVKIWNRKYTWPKLVISSMQHFFVKFEEKYADILPRLQGDLTEYWTDGVATSAAETALYRNDLERMQQLETLCAMTGARLPEKDQNEAWRNLLLYCDHTWGAHNSVLEPDSDLAKDQWQVKQAFALDAHAQINRMYAAVAGKPAGQTFSVVNTTAFPKCEMVTLSAAQSKAGDIVVDGGGKAVLSQRLSTGELAFIAEIKPFSSVRYSVKPGKSASRSTLVSGSHFIENEYYKLVLDAPTGNIESIFSKTLHRELVNKKDSLKMNQFVYFITKNYDRQTHQNQLVYNDKTDTLKLALNPRISVKESGPVVVTLQVKFDAPYCKSMNSEFSLVAGSDRVEISNAMDKISVREKESVNFAFPFDVPSAQIRYDIPAGYATVEADQLPGSNKNWYTVQRWVQVGNGDFSVVWSSPDAPMCCFGGITNRVIGKQKNSPRWIETLNPGPTVVSWPLNNYWFTNFKADQEGPMTFRYYITAQKGNDPFAANRFGVDNSQKLIVTSAQADKQLPVEMTMTGDGAYISHLKSSLDGKACIMNLINLHDREVKVNFGSQAVRCNLTEDAVGAPAKELTLTPREVTLIKFSK